MPPVQCAQDNLIVEAQGVPSWFELRETCVNQVGAVSAANPTILGVVRVACFRLPGRLHTTFTTNIMEFMLLCNISGKECDAKEEKDGADACLRNCTRMHAGLMWQFHGQLGSGAKI